MWRAAWDSPPLGARRPAKRVALLIISQHLVNFPPSRGLRVLSPLCCLPHSLSSTVFSDLGGLEESCSIYFRSFEPRFLSALRRDVRLSGIPERAAERHRSVSLYHQLLSSRLSIRLCSRLFPPYFKLWRPSHGLRATARPADPLDPRLE